MNQRERECPDKAIYPTPARKRNLKRVACYALLGAAAAFITVPGVANAELDNKGVFSSSTIPAIPTSISCSALVTTKSSPAILGTAPLSSTMGTF